MQLGKDFKRVLRQIEEEKGLSAETIISSLEAAMILSLIHIFANAAATDQILSRWGKKIKLIDREDQVSNLEIRATYYSTEYVEALVQSEAQKNLWTQQAADEYKYLSLIHICRISNSSRSSSWNSKTNSTHSA